MPLLVVLVVRVVGLLSVVVLLLPMVFRWGVCVAEVARLYLEPFGAGP